MFGLDESKLVKVSQTRGKIKEISHLVAISVVDEDLNLVFSSSDDKYLVYPRSSVKMVQALPIILSSAYDNYKLTDKHLALASSSHHGDTMHSELVKSWLDHVDIDQELLHCGVMSPISKQAKIDLTKANLKPNKLQHMCSGKHTCMLTYAKQYDWKLKDYQEHDHKVQREVAKIFSEFTDLDANQYPSFKDGCTVTTWALPLANWARAMAKFVSGNGLPQDYFSAAKKIYDAQVAHPELMTSSIDLDTTLIKDASGNLVIKSGADGVEIAVCKSPKLGIAVKSVDGSERGAQSSIVALLKALNLLNNDKEYLPKIKTTYDDIVGEIEVDFPQGLVEGLKLGNSKLVSI